MNSSRGTGIIMPPRGAGPPYPGRTPALTMGLESRTALGSLSSNHVFLSTPGGFQIATVLPKNEHLGKFHGVERRNTEGQKRQAEPRVDRSADCTKEGCDEDERSKRNELGKMRGKDCSPTAHHATNGDGNAESRVLKEDTADEGILADLQLPGHGLSLADTDPATSIDCASTKETLSEKRQSAETIQTTAPEDDEISATMPLEKQHPVLGASSTGQKLSQVEIALPVHSMCPGTKKNTELMDVTEADVDCLSAKPVLSPASAAEGKEENGCCAETQTSPDFVRRVASSVEKFCKDSEEFSEEVSIAELRALLDRGLSIARLNMNSFKVLVQHHPAL
jgi:hypothetical protein